MPSFNENPTEFADLNDAFPELSSQVGLSYEQVRAIGENTYFNHNQIGTKANKAANATAGHIAALDSSGNVADSGVAPADLQEKMQYSTMPTASADNVGAIVQYIGDTDNTYTNGYFYKCVESSGTYGWEEVISGGGGGDVPANMVTTDTTQTITGRKIFRQDTSINGLTVKRTGIFNNNYGVGYDEYVDALGRAWGLFRETPTGEVKRVVSFNHLLMSDTGDNIQTRLTNGALLNNQTMLCIEDSTNNDFEAGNIYQFNYDSENDSWNAESIGSIDGGGSGYNPIVLQNVSASTWVSDNTYTDYGYKCELSVNGVTANDWADVVFGVAEATSGNYSPDVETGANKVIIYSKVDTAITIPTIKVDKL